MKCRQVCVAVLRKHVCGQTGVPSKDNGSPKVAGLRNSVVLDNIAVFQDKDDQWDPDQDLYSLSDNYEDDEEAQALINQVPYKPMHAYPYTPVEGDATVG